MLAFVLVLVFSSPLKLASHAVESVDCIELNHHYDKSGKHIYDQVIFWERTPTTGRFQVRSWCLVDDREALDRRPAKNEATGLYQVDWFDTDQRLQRTISSRLYRESWSMVDPERDNKRLHSEQDRISLAHRLSKESQE